MPRKSTVFSPKQAASRKYKTYEVSQALQDCIGTPERGFSMLIWGAPGHGKTTFMIWLMKEFSKYGKCYLNSAEMGEGTAMQSLVNRNDMGEIDSDKVAIGNKHSWEEMIAVLDKNRAVFAFIDSVDYVNMGKQHFQFLKERFPSKCFIMITWAEGKHPASKASKSIEYMVDIKTYVRDGVAFTRSRFGQTAPYVIIPSLARNSNSKDVLKVLREDYVNTDLSESG